MVGLVNFFRDHHFTQLEINPFVLDGTHINCLDMVAEVDDSAGNVYKYELALLNYKHNQTSVNNMTYINDQKLVNNQILVNAY